jgi:DNA-binding MarR family transcriptional regulator
MSANVTKSAPSRKLAVTGAPERKVAPLNATATRDLRIGFLIHDVSRLRRNMFDQYMKPLGVTRSQWWVIAHLARKDGMMQTELASLLDVGKVTLGGLVDRLEAGGWINRRPAPGDRRVKNVFLTEQSLGLLQEMRAVEKDLNQGVLKGFNPVERHQLADLLTRLRANLIGTLDKARVSDAGVDDD